MAVFIDKSGDMYLNGFLGVPGTDTNLPAYRIGVSGYRRLTRYYGASLAATSITLVAAVTLSASSLAAEEPILLVALSVVNALLTVGAAFLSRRYQLETVALANCTGESRLSNLIYLFLITVLASQTVIFLERRIYIAAGICLLLGGYFVWRMVVWCSRLRSRPA